MEIYRTQNRSAGMRYLILTDPDPKTGVLRAVVADTETQTVQRVKSVPALLRSEKWQTPGKDAPALDTLVQEIPALRRHRGIEIRLPSGVTAWVLWREWSAADADVQALLTETTQSIAIPAHEPDGDYFLASHAAKVLGGEVLDPARSVFALGEAAY